jgi:probable rRNA maturation factor
MNKKIKSESHGQNKSVIASTAKQSRYVKSSKKLDCFVAKSAPRNDKREIGVTMLHDSDMYQIIIQYEVDKRLAPSKLLLRQWAIQALSSQLTSGQVTLRLVTSEEMAELNTAYRRKSGPTNVLSFPFSLPEEIKTDIPMLGDIVICPDVVNREAKEQQKSQKAHFAHMIVHGIFHLLGYDHEIDEEANVMESLEKKIMHSLGFPNPYLTNKEKHL